MWAEAVSTVVCILNRSPTKRLGEMTPEEACSRRKPNVNHMRIFGCLCYRHVPKRNRRKLDTRAQPMIMIGYHITSAYILLDPIQKKVIISNDVVFDENKSWEWKADETSSRNKNVTVDLENQNNSDVEKKCRSQ